jgi:hypothetical protein
MGQGHATVWCNMGKQVEPSVIVLKVALQARKGIWRRIAIRSDQSLDEFHAAIFRAFDREDEHLYSFYFPKAGLRGQDAIRQGIEFTHPMCFSDDNPFMSSGRNAATARLGELRLTVGKKFKYLFDFGDCWWHEITVESVDSPIEAGSYPRELQRRGESPPQYPDFEDDDDE